MTRRRRIPTSPFDAWTQLASRYAEMAAAATHVIAHRTSRPNNPAQLFEMGNEKFQAAMESSHAMTRHWMGLSSRSAAGLPEAWARMLTSGLAPYHTRATRNSRRARRRKPR